MPMARCGGGDELQWHVLLHCERAFNVTVERLDLPSRFITTGWNSINRKFVVDIGGHLAFAYAQSVRTMLKTTSGIVDNQHDCEISIRSRVL